MRISILKAAALSVTLGAVPVLASSIATVETQAANSAATVGDGSNNAIITQVLSTPTTPATLDGYTYKNWSFLVNDGTGSMDVFNATPLPGGYIPVAGNGVDATGTYSPFDGIPEIDGLSSISTTTTLNTIPAPSVFTIPQLDAATSSSFNIMEYVVQLNNVYIGFGAPATWPTHANLNFNLTDGTNNLAGFFWASSYSVDGAMGGTAIPTGAQDVTGFMSLFTSGGVTEAQFTPISFTSVPEPASAGLLAMGALGLLRRRRNA
jgi:hypothetical protein